MATYIDDDGVEQVVPVFLRTPYNYNMDAASVESGLRCEDESLAVQSAKEECDINTIVRKFGLTGELPSDVKMPMSGDYTNVLDYQSALNVVIAADDAFMEFPAEVRARFANDPQKLFEFVSDKANLDEARKLGLAIPAAPEPVIPVVRVAKDEPGTGST